MVDLINKSTQNVINQNRNEKCHLPTIIIFNVNILIYNI